MKVGELLEELSVIDKWLGRQEKNIRALKLATNKTGRFTATQVTFTNIAVFKKPIPVHFDYVNIYSVRECPGVTSLSQLNVLKTDSLSVQYSDITDCEGCPEAEILSLDHNYKLSSLKGITNTVSTLNLLSCTALKTVDEDLPNCTALRLSFSGIQTLSGIQKRCPKLESINLTWCDNLSSGLLGLLRIPTLKEITADVGSNELLAVVGILNKHLKDKNIGAAQTELFKNGLKEYAKL